MVGPDARDALDAVPRQREQRLGVAGAVGPGRVDGASMLRRRGRGGERGVDLQAVVAPRLLDRRLQRRFEMGAHFAERVRAARSGPPPSRGRRP